MGWDRACGRPRWLRRGTIGVAVLACALFAVPNALSTVYTVNRSDDIDHGICDAVLGCTLRDAINAANNTAGHDDITFQIGIGGSYTISPSAPLPHINDDVTIDGTTQTGYAGAPLITLAGWNLGATDPGLYVNSGAPATIEGLAITRFGGSGIMLEADTGGSFIKRNYIGLDSNGSTPQPNGIGISVFSAGNTVGGSTLADRNVISGNSQQGIFVKFNGGNTIQNNYIGTDASGQVARPNSVGIEVQSDANRIGDGNVISGNSGSGVAIASSHNEVLLNYIGTNADGDTALGNPVGVQIRGGATPANINEIDRNVISANGSGVIIAADQPDSTQGNTIWGNFIGTAADGTTALGNSGAGVAISMDGGIGNNTIGGSSDNASNTIAYNVKGIAAGTGTSRNSFLSNSIHDNKFAGIDLSDDGVTTNDPGDDDNGANGLMNYPAIVSLSRSPNGGVDDVTGNVDGPVTDAGTTYRLDFFASPACDSVGGNGEGTTWLGTITTEPASASGDATFATGTSLFTYVAPDSVITATATDESGNTSEFSDCTAVPSTSAMTFTVTDPADSGPGTLREAIVAANQTPGTDTIDFNLPGPVLKISVASPLPTLSEAVIIDGTTQPGTTPGKPTVQIDGADAGFGAVGLDDEGLDGSIIRGLSITGFTGKGIYLGAPAAIVEGNYIGLAPDGTAAPNGSGPLTLNEGGIEVRSGSNRIGGTTDQTRNVISGNDGVGISFSSQPGNVAVGNRIGTNADGTAAVPNSGDGIGFEDVNFQTIGGTAAGEGNLISGNGGNGLYFNSGYEMTAAKFQGNTIGLAADGVTPLPNGGAGIFLDGVSDGGRIGGTSPGAGNVISGNLGTGVLIDGSDGWRLEGNLIGVTAAGTALAPNGASQVVVDNSDSVTIGGTIAAARNVISGGSTSAGVILDSLTADSHVEGNYIGTNAAGTAKLGNGTGIQVVGGAHDNAIGGVVAGAGNVISGSDRGVQLDNAGSGNRVVGNSIGTNAAETAVIANGVGVELDGMTDAQVGTTSPGAGNVIGGSSDAGILVAVNSTSIRIAGNHVGTNRNGTASLPNGDGIRFDSSIDDLVGPDNVIANNTGDGIEVGAGNGNRISANSIHDNGGKGILLNEGNNDQESPNLTSAVKAGANTNIAGTLASAPNTGFFVEYFLTPTCTGQPQGQTYLGFQEVTTDEIGQGSLSFATGAAAVGQAITATATSEATDDTSEFSACATVTASLSIAPEADTFVSDGAPTTNYGTQDFADTYGGFSQSCVPLSAPAYTLMRFDLSSIPAGATITHVELDTTTRAGYAQDGDPAHWAIFVPTDAWSETGVTWDTRPADGLTTVGDPAFSGGPDIRQSSLSMGAADVWRNGCTVDPDPAGNQAKVFPSTTDGFPRTVADTEAGFIDRVTTERNGDGKLSLELWTPNCPSCPAGANKAYWARYFTREAADPTVRPKLVVSFTNVAEAANVQLTGPGQHTGRSRVGKAR